MGEHGASSASSKVPQARCRAWLGAGMAQGAADACASGTGQPAKEGAAGAGLCDETGKFRGMLLERLHGRVVDKVIMRADFADVHYVRAFLLSVFTALGKAQAWLGARPPPARSGRPLTNQLPGGRLASAACTARRHVRTHCLPAAAILNSQLGCGGLPCADRDSL